MLQHQPSGCWTKVGDKSINQGIDTTWDTIAGLDRGGRGGEWDDMLRKTSGRTSRWSRCDDKDIKNKNIFSYKIVGGGPPLIPVDPPDLDPPSSPREQDLTGELLRVIDM